MSASLSNPRESAKAWGARMAQQFPTPAPRQVPEDGPAMKAALAAAADAGKRMGEALIADAAELGIEGPLALTGRYSAAPIPAPATALDRAYADINALGGYVDRKDPEAVARDELLGEVLTILERHGARDLPAALLQVAA